MLVYRYEKEDRGGPFCTFDGHLRTDPSLQMNDDYLSGCDSLEALLQYWEKQNIPEILKDCKIKVYDVPEEAIKKSSSHILWPKTYSPIEKCIDYP